MNENHDQQRGRAHQIVIVMAVPADGAMALAKILYLRPSWARARVKPMMAAFAVEY